MKATLTFIIQDLFISYSLKLDQVKFIDMLGKWKPVEITNEINFELYEIPAEDMVNLPVKNSENDYLNSSTQTEMT